jgi:hypothetical protein
LKDFRSREKKLLKVIQ